MDIVIGCSTLPSGLPLPLKRVFGQNFQWVPLFWPDLLYNRFCCHLFFCIWPAPGKSSIYWRRWRAWGKGSSNPIATDMVAGLTADIYGIGGSIIGYSICCDPKAETETDMMDEALILPR
jgi:hypothetical protein